MTYEIDAPIHAVQAALGNAVCDGSPTEPGRCQLSPRDHTALPSSRPGNRPIATCRRFCTQVMQDLREIPPPDPKAGHRRTKSVSPACNA